MKHSILSLTAALLTAGLFSSAAQAATVTIDSLIYQTNENGTASVTGRYTRPGVRIHDSITVDGITYTVTSIGDRAFRYFDSLTEIIIPDSITSIGDSAFSGCRSLKKIIIPDSVTSIGESAFGACTSLTHVTLGNGVTSIGEGAFSDCDSLTHVTLGNGVTSIGEEAFYSCNSLTHVTLGNGVTSIGDSAFAWCDSLNWIYFESQTPPEVGSYVFSGCPSNMIIYYPEGAEANWGTEWKGFTAVPWGTFILSPLTFTLDFVSQTASITACDSAYEGQVVIPLSITLFNVEYAVVSIADAAFAGCCLVESIYFQSQTPLLVGENAFEGCSNDLIIYYPLGAEANWPAEWQGFFTQALDPLTYEISEDGTASVTGCDADFSGPLYIPSTVTMDGTTYTITSIGSWAFEDCDSLTEIIIPDSVTSIGEYAFRDCDSLTEIIIPDSVTTIGNWAFSDCTSLTEIIIPDSVTSIGDGAFSDCTSLTHVTIPDSVTEIAGTAFYNCTSLTEIIIPDSVTEIGESAFWNCTSLTEIIIPDSVTTIGNWAFQLCTALTEIIIPDSVTFIRYGAFQYCTALTHATLGNGVTTIVWNAFQYCTSLNWIYFQSQTPPTMPGSFVSYGCPSNMIIYYPEGAEANWETTWRGLPAAPWGSVVLSDVSQRIDSETGSTLFTLSITAPAASGTSSFSSDSGLLSIPESITIEDTTYPVTHIGYGAFEDCTALTEIIIPDSVTTIGLSAFSGCDSLTRVTLGSGVTSIAGGAFHSCDSLTEIQVSQENSSYQAIEGILFSKDGTLLHTYPAGKPETSYTIPDFVTAIGERAFYECSSLTEIIIPDSVTSIGNSAFYNCTSLTNAVIGNGVTSIGDSAFYSCDSLTEIIIPDSVTSIGDSAFYWCDSLTEIQVNENNSSYQSIEGILFSKDGTLLHTYPAGKPDTSYIIPDSVTSIGNGAFYECSSLTEIIIPDSVTSIGNSAFWSCDSLTHITIPDSVTSIGSWAFYWCRSLTHVTLGNGVTSIGESAFYSCDSLTEIIIPDSVTSIGNYAFYDCTALSGIYFQSQTPPKVGSYVFDYCPENMIIYYPEGAEANWGTKWQGFATKAWNPDALIVTAENKVRLYGTVNPELTYTITDIFGAVVTVSGSPELSTTATPESPVGEYPITLTQGTLDTNYSYTFVEGILTVTPTPIVEVTIDSLTYTTAEDATASVTDCPEDLAGTVTIPSSITVEGITYTVTSIGYGAFEDCTALTEIIIPDSVTSIGNSAFYSCDSLTEIIIPDSVTEIGDYAFYSCDSLTEIIIPDSVTEIGDYAFYSCDSLTNAVIGNGVTSIGDSAFSGCYSLTHVTLGNGVTSIGEDAFYSCDSLTHVTLGNGITSIGYGAFRYCDSLTEIQVSQENTVYQSIEGILFSKDGTLLHTYPAGKPESSYTIPDSVTSIGDYAFSYCTSLTEIIIPDSVTEIGDYAFYSCDSLTHVTLGNGVTSIGEDAFRYCDSLTGIYFQSQTPPQVGSSVFSGCPENMIIYYPAGAEANWGTEWQGFATTAWNPEPIPTALIVTAENKVRPYGTVNPELTYTITDETGAEFSVSGSPELSTTATPESPVGEYPITLTQGTLDTNYSYTFVEGILTVTPTPIVEVTIDSLTYTTAEDATASVTDCPEDLAGTVTIPSSITVEGTAYTVTTIGNGAFFGCDSLTQITLGNGVTSIGSSAFNSCKSLNWICFQSQTPPEVGSYVFDYCPENMIIYYPEGAEANWGTEWQGFVTAPWGSVVLNGASATIDSETGSTLFTLSITAPTASGLWTNSFSSDSGLLSIPESITIEDTTYPVTSIGNDAFYYCTSLTEIIIPDSVTSIGSSAFSHCRSLTEIIIPDSVTSIGSYAFYWCDSLTHVTLGNGVTSIGESAFRDCTSLTNITIPDSVTSIGESAFIWCSSLTEIVIPDSVTSIGSYAFAYCDSLTEIVIPDSVTSIGYEAFAYCKSLTGIYFQSQTPPKVGSSVFSGCPSNMIIYYPEGAEANWGTEWQGFATTAWNPEPIPTALIVTAENKVRPYGTVNPELTYTITDETGAEFSLSGSPELSTTATPESPVGEYPITLTQGTLDTNYSYTFVEGILTVTPTPIVEVTIDSLTYTTAEDATASVTDCPEDLAGTVTIPSSITVEGLTYTVTSIGYGAFEDCSSLTEIIIPDSVTSIGNGAFSGCDSLNWIYFQSQTPPKVGSSVFYGCPSNMIIYYPAGAEANWGTEWQGFATTAWNPTALIVTAENKVRPYGTVNPELTYTITDETGAEFSLSGSPELSTTATPESPVGEYPITLTQGTLDTNYSYTFVEGILTVTPTPIVEVTIDSLTYTTAEDATASVTDCPEDLAGTVTIPSSITVEGITYTVTSIGYMAFRDCDSLTEIIIPDSVISIGEYAFCWCDSLTHVTLGNGVISIGESAFSGCFSLKKIQVSENNSSYQSIEGILFSKDGTLLHTYPAGKPDTSYIIPDSVTSIGERAFEYCTSLNWIYFQSQTPPEVGYSVFYNCPENMIIYYPEGAEANWGTEWKGFAAAPWGSVVLSDASESIDSETGSTLFTLSITAPVPDGLWTNSFSSDSGLLSIPESITIEDTTYPVTHIGYKAFSDCTSLTKVTIPDSVTTIGYQAFMGCRALTEIVIPNSVTLIEESAFSGCEALSHLALGNGLNTIGDNAFMGCKSLSSITIPNSVTTIGAGAFASCSSLSQVILPDALTTIESMLFSSCSSLTAITLPDTITSIGEMAFADCVNLTRINIPDSVTEIGNWAFAFCEALPEITLSSSLAEIGDRVFTYCKSLMRFFFASEQPPLTGILPFYYCPEQAIIYYPAGAEANWGTEWQGFATEAWDPNGIPSLPESVTIDPLTFTLIPGTETYTVSACDPNYTGELIIPSSISIGSAPENSSEVIPADSLTYPVVSIEPDAFAGCSLITRIIIPETVTSIGNAAFNGCTELKEVYFSSSEPPAMEIGTLFEGCSEELVIYYPENTEDNWTPALEGTTIPSRTWDPAVGPAPEQPSLTCGAVSKNLETGEISFTLTFTGILQESADGITWSDVSDAAEGTYTVTVQKNQNRFFRAIVH